MLLVALERVLTTELADVEWVRPMRGLPDVNPWLAAPNIQISSRRTLDLLDTAPPRLITRLPARVAGTDPTWQPVSDCVLRIPWAWAAPRRQKA